MKPINTYKEFLYYRTMYRRAVVLLVIMSILSVVMSLFLLYAYQAQPPRQFFASAKTYNITEIRPISY